jgi:MFS family permease
MTDGVTVHRGIVAWPIRAVRRQAGKARQFFGRQKPNYRVTVTRAALSSFLGGLTAQYNSIYAVALGASPVQLGALNSTGGAVSALMSAPAGWLVDRYGLKRFYVVGIGLMALAAGVYGVAWDWRLLIVAAALTALSVRLIGPGCSVLCADQLLNRDRATGQNACNAIASVSLALAPLIGAVLVTRFGGLTAPGLRPLYYIQFAGYGLIALFVAARLREPMRQRLAHEQGRVGILRDFRRVFEDGSHLKKWIAVACLSQLPFAMVLPFMQVFANQVKGAEQFTLSIMGVAMVSTQVLFGIPLGRLADRLGRKKVILLVTPLWYLSSIMLLLAPGPAGLVLAGALWGFYPIMTVITSSMTLELVSLEQMGRWSGLLGVFGGLVAVPTPLASGLIWQHLGPAYVFIVPLIVDIAIRVPLLTMIPETLWKQRTP